MFPLQLAACSALSWSPASGSGNVYGDSARPLRTVPVSGWVHRCCRFAGPKAVQSSAASSSA